MTRKIDNDKKNIVQALVASDVSNTRISQIMDVSIGYVSNATHKLERDEAKIKALANKIQQQMINERLIRDKTTGLCLDGYISDVIAGKKEPNPIALVAIKDRNFNQLQVLKEQQTVDVSWQTAREELEALKVLKARTPAKDEIITVDNSMVEPVDN